MTDASSTPAARLSVSDRTGRRVVPIDKSPFTIGRGPDNNLRVFSAEVSRTHAEVVIDGDRYLLRDRASRYGTFVNGEMRAEHVLVDGDRIRLGRSAAVDILFLNQREGVASAESLVGAVRQTGALLEGLRALGAAHLLQDVLVLVLDAAIDVSGADRGFIMLATAAGPLEFTLARARGHVTLPGLTFRTSHRIPEEVFTTGEPCIVSDLIEGDAGDDHSATVALGIRQVLCVPLRLVRYADRPDAMPERKRIGVLYLDGRESGSLLSSTARIGVEALATEAAIAIENARLYRESVEKERVDQELRVAAVMQRALGPSSRYRGGDFEIAATLRSSRSIGGDFFDYVELPGQIFGLALGDVAGKGPPAAVLAGALQGMFAAFATGQLEPGETLARVNHTLVEHFAANWLATLIYAVLRPGGRLTYSSAGHNPPVLFTGTATRRLRQGGVPLGLFVDARFPEESLQLRVGDMLVVFSDGVSDASNEAGEPFGDDRIVSSVQANVHLGVDAVLAELLDAVRDFSGGAAAEDDMTAIVLRYLG